MRSFAFGIVFLFLNFTSVWAESWQDVALKVDQSVGRVITNGGTGSGFAVGYAENGRDVYFVTNYHVIDGAKKVVVGFGKDQKVYDYKAKIVNRSKELDLAILLLQVKDNAKHKIEIVPVAIETPPKGLDVFAVGFPGSSDLLVSGVNRSEFFETTLTRGSVSKISTGTWDDSTRNLEIISHTASINRGNSGGPLFDFCGRVVGVNTAYLKENNNVYLSSSSTVVAGFLDSAETQFMKAVGSCDPDSFSHNFKKIFPWLIGVVAIAGIGLVSYLLFSQKFNSNGRSKRQLASGVSSNDKASLYIVVQQKDGQIKKHSVTGKQLRSGAVIGRSRSGDVLIDAEKISREHARIKLVERKLMLEDLGSTNGSMLDGRKIPPNKPQQINSKSKIVLGDSRISISRPK